MTAKNVEPQTIDKMNVYFSIVIKFACLYHKNRQRLIEVIFGIMLLFEKSPSKKKDPTKKFIIFSLGCCKKSHSNNHHTSEGLNQLN